MKHGVVRSSGLLLCLVCCMVLFPAGVLSGEKQDIPARDKYVLRLTDSWIGHKDAIERRLEKLDEPKVLPPSLNVEIDKLIAEFHEVTDIAASRYRQYSKSHTRETLRTTVLYLVILLRVYDEMIEFISNHEAVQAKLKEGHKVLMENLSVLTPEDIVTMTRLMDDYGKLLAKTKEETPLDEVIHEYNSLKLKDFLDKATYTSLARFFFSSKEEVVKQKVLYRVRKIMFRASKIFGDTAGAIKLRRPAIRGAVKHEVKKALEKILEPCDILVEKSGYALTDKLIPGYFGHVAIWIGTEESLRREGIWDLLTSDVQRMISKGYTIVEAVRPRVRASNLDIFLAIDDLAVLRLRPELLGDDPAATKAKIILKAFSLLFRQYDYVFDLNTSKQVMCAEVAYIVLPEQIEWNPRKYPGGVYTISPDDVAAKAGPDPVFELELVCFLIEGEPVPDAMKYFVYWSKLVREGYKLPDGRKGEVLRRLLYSPSLFKYHQTYDFDELLRDLKYGEGGLQ